MLNVFNLSLELGSFFDFCKEKSLDSTAIQDLASDNVEIEKKIWADTSGKRFYPVDIIKENSDISSILRHSALRIPEYQKSLSFNDDFVVNSPFNGKAIKAFMSLPCDLYHVAFAFSDVHEFFILVGRWHGRRAALIIPELSAVFMLDAPEKQDAMVEMMSNSVRRLKKSRLYQSYNSTPNRPHIGNKRKTLLVGLKENLGHYFWQEMSGIERVIEMGAQYEDFDIVSCPNRWLSVEELFPEIEFHKHTKLKQPSDILNYDSDLYDEERTWIKPVGLNITRRMQKRIFSACKNGLDEAKFNFIKSTCEKNNVLWVNLRSHNKAWKSQISGVIELSKSLANSIPNFAVFLDGFGDSISLADAIAPALEKESISVFYGIDLPFKESVMWAHHVSSFISVIGSGLVLNSWLVSKAGVAHGNLAHLNQQKFWNDVAEESEQVVFLKESEVVGSTAMYGEYDFDWKIFLEPLIELMSDKNMKM